jgi:hypothetical protein
MSHSWAEKAQGGSQGYLGVASSDRDIVQAYLKVLA